MPEPGGAAMITTRLAVHGDLDRVAQLFDLYRQFYGKAPDLVASREFIRERMEGASSILYVAEAQDSGTIAFCQLYPSLCSLALGRILILHDLFCHPSARRSGAARALLQAAAVDAWRAGYGRMDLMTARDNVAAQALYESLGWVRDDLYWTYNLRSAGASTGARQ